MIPKRIYLREADFDDLLTGERMVSCDEPFNDLNVEYTDLSQIWHDASEEPKINEDVVLFDSCGNFVTEFYNGDVTWNNIVLFHKATMWAYISDLLPKGGER